MKTRRSQWDGTNLITILDNFEGSSNKAQQIQKRVLSANLINSKVANFLFKSGKNLFNAEGDFLYNCRLEKEGKLSCLNEYVTTNAILIKPNTSYQSTHQYWSCQYTETGKFLKYNHVKYRETLKTETNAAYLIISIPTNAVQSFMLAEGTEPISYANDYSPFEITMNHLDFSMEETFAKNIIKNAWFENGLSDWTINSGKVTIQNKERMNCLVMDATTSSQIRQKISLKENHKYYISFEVEVTRYVKGLFGVQVNGNLECGKGFNIGKRTVTNGFERMSSMFKAVGNSENCIYVGSINSADGAGKIGKLNLYDLTEIYGQGDEPTLKHFDLAVLPSNQAEMTISATDSFRVLDKKIGYLSKEKACNLSPTDKECTAAFIQIMNQKCKQLGMKDTNFLNPHGLSVKGQVSTTRDMLLLTRHATGFDSLLKVWGAKKYRVHFKGRHDRNVVVSTTVSNSVLEEKYTILGGKSGTIGSIFNALGLIADEEENIYVATVMKAGSTTDRYEDIKKLVDVAKKKLKNPSYIPEENFTALSGSVGVIKNNPLFWTNAPKQSLYSFNENQRGIPASMTKVMTAIVMLEHIHALEEVITIKNTDITGGSGPLMYDGDQINFLDILYLLMLPSSNSAATVTARVIGEKIIQARGYI